MKNFDDILDEISQNENFSLLKIKKYYAKSIRKLIREIYSYDYAPFWHLKDKTEYLKRKEREIAFIFVENKNPKPDYFGKGQFRHKECHILKQLKYLLREKYNPKINGNITNDHVIHATDCQEQTNHILKYIGINEGVKHFQKKNKFIESPFYIDKIIEAKIKIIDIDKLKCNILSGKNWRSNRVKCVYLKDSPQYRSLIEGENVYDEYLKKYFGNKMSSYYSVKKYEKLKENFKYLQKPHCDLFVIVAYIKNEYLIIDGIHRASLHKSQGSKKIKVCQIIQ